MQYIGIDIGSEQHARSHWRTSIHMGSHRIEVS